MEISHHRILRLPGKIRFPQRKRVKVSLLKNVLDLLHYIKLLGYRDTLGQYELLKLGIFNQLNFFQLLAGVFILCTCIFHHQFPGWACIVAALPALVNALATTSRIAASPPTTSAVRPAKPNDPPSDMHFSHGNVTMG